MNKEKIIADLSCNIISADQVSDILGSPQEFPTALIEQLSVEIALKYWNGQLSYESADCIINNLYSFWINNNYFKTHLFTDAAWECYEAFDSGEYYRDGDDRSVSPDVRYTMPLVEEFLRKRMLIP